MNTHEMFDLAKYELKSENLSWIDQRTLAVKRWNWDYSLAHSFQRKALEAVNENPRLRILICCSHPRVLTNGRGLQKPRKGETLELVDFKLSDYPSLPYPFHQIERGGGLTFHHPGQFIFYPVLKLNPESLSLSRMTNEIFDFAIDVLTVWGIANLHHANKLLGLWYGDRKMASMGIAIEKLTTFHGMALNLYQDPEMKSALNRLNPCGLHSDLYIAADEIIKLPAEAMSLFADEFLKRILHAWK
jgi:lipoyl(octanoyl) transferase